MAAGQRGGGRGRRAVRRLRADRQAAGDLDAASATGQPINNGDGKTGAVPVRLRPHLPGRPLAVPVALPVAVHVAARRRRFGVAVEVAHPVRPRRRSRRPRRGQRRPRSRPATPAALHCTVTYKVTSQWQGGFQGDVTVAVTGGTVNGWTLGFAFGAGQVISQVWNATLSQTGTGHVKDVELERELGSAAFGFIASWSGSNTAPTAFTLNGTACAAG